MSACEMCWYLASQDAQLFGGSVADHYHRRLAETDDHPQTAHVGHATEPTTAETVLAAFPELRDTDYGRYLDSLTRDAERYLLEEARFTIPADMEGDN